MGGAMRAFKQCRWWVVSFIMAALSPTALAATFAEVANQRLQHIAERAGWPEAAAVVVRADAEPALLFYGEAANANRKYLLGSASKPLTALTTLRLVAAGKLELDAPVRALLPQLAWRDEPADRPVTVRDLLQHRSGLTRAHGMTAMPATLTANTIQLADITLATRPGSHYHYSNLNYLLLGLLIEQVTGQPFAEALSAQLLRPLGMDRTAVVLDPGRDLDMATGHQYWFAWARPVAQPIPAAAMAPAGYIATTAGDISKLLRLMLGSGVVAGERFLPEPLWQAMLTPPETTSGYGMGWSVFPWGEHQSYAHDGLLPAYSASLQVWPAQQVAMAVLVPVNEGIFAPARDVLLGDLYRLAQTERSAADTQAFVPKERLFRAALALLLLLLMGRLLWALWRWRQRRQPALLATRMQQRRLLTAVLFQLAVLLALMWWFKVPAKVVVFQPDLAVALLLAPFLTVLRGVFARAVPAGP